MNSAKSTFSSLVKGRSHIIYFLAATFILFLLPLIISKFWLCLLIEIIILGLAGMSLNLLFGYSGSLPFGHAAFYASGAYTTAILLKQTGVPLSLALAAAPLVAAAMGSIFALLTARLYRFYYAMITLAFSMLLWTIIRKWASFTGGDNGMTGVPVPHFLSGVIPTYLFILTIFLLCIGILWLIINSPFGWTLRAIRENPNRVAFICVDVTRYRYFAFIISSFFTGIAGALYVIYSHSTFPDYAYWVKSGDILMICLLGGMFSFFGPLIGAAILVLLQTIVTSFTIYWPLVMGTVICVVVLIMPDGVLGFKNFGERYGWNIFSSRMAIKNGKAIKKAV